MNALSSRAWVPGMAPERRYRKADDQPDTAFARCGVAGLTASRPNGGRGLAILPGPTHYSILSSPLFAADTLPFLDGQSS